MTNKDVLYAKWLSGEISDEELKAQAGADALIELKRVVNNVDQWTISKYDTTLGYDKFKRKHIKEPTKIRKINWFKLSSIAASLLLVVFIGNYFLSNPNEMIVAENGQNQNSVLSDGSEISLNDGSSISYNAKSWNEARTIELTGEALFEVTKGSPFVVNTTNGKIEVLGTKFNVKARGNNLYVECYEGKVQVTSNKQNTILTANQGVNVIEGIMAEKEVITATAPTWQNGMSRFRNENLQTVFEEMERQYDVKIYMKVKDRKFTGSFQHNDLEKALRVVCKPMDLNFTFSDDQKTIMIE